MDEIINKYLEYTITITIFVFVGISLIFSNDTIYDNVSRTIPIVTAIYVIYSKWLWRYNPFEKTPKLKKQYKGYFISTYENQNKKYSVDFKIKQSLFHTEVTCTTKESSSRTINAHIYCDKGECRLIYNYMNEPQNVYTDRSPIHYGTCILSLEDINNITGKYYTARNTKGDIVLKCSDSLKKK